MFQAVDEVPSFNVFYMGRPGLARPTGKGAGLWEQETSPVVAETNGSKTWEWVLACGQVWVRLRGGH